MCVCLNSRLLFFFSKFISWNIESPPSPRLNSLFIQHYLVTELNYNFFLFEMIKKVAKENLTSKITIHHVIHTVTEHTQLKLFQYCSPSPTHSSSIIVHGWSKDEQKKKKKNVPFSWVTFFNHISCTRT